MSQISSFIQRFESHLEKHFFWFGLFISFAFSLFLCWPIYSWNDFWTLKISNFFSESIHSSSYSESLISSMTISIPMSIDLIFDHLSHKSSHHRQGTRTRLILFLFLSIPDYLTYYFFIPHDLIFTFWSLTHIRIMFTFTAIICFLQKHNAINCSVKFSTFIILLFNSALLLRFFSFFFEESEVLLSCGSSAFLLVFCLLLYKFSYYLRLIFENRSKFFSLLFPSPLSSASDPSLSSEFFLCFSYLLSLLGLLLSLISLFSYFSITSHSKWTSSVPSRFLPSFTYLMGGFVFCISFIHSRKTNVLEHLTQQTLETKRHFVRYFSHEMRSPLNSISAALQLVLEYDRSSRQWDEESRRDILEISKEASLSCDSAVSILNDLLLYEKLEGGVLRLERREEGAVSVVQEALHELRFVARQQGVQISLKLDDLLSRLHPSVSSPFLKSLQTNFDPSSPSSPPVTVSMDRGRISQVLRILLSNALKHTAQARRSQASPLQHVSNTHDLKKEPHQTQGSQGTVEVRLSLISLNNKKKNTNSRRIKSVSLNRNRQGDYFQKHRIHAQGEGQREGEGEREGSIKLNSSSYSSFSSFSLDPSFGLTNTHRHSPSLSSLRDSWGADNMGGGIGPLLSENIRRHFQSGFPPRPSLDQPIGNDSLSLPHKDIEAPPPASHPLHPPSIDEKVTSAPPSLHPHQSSMSPSPSPSPQYLFRIEIKDRGPGLSPEKQQRLFRDVAGFDVNDLQGEGEGGGGGGLGLFVSRGIVDLHGGSISVYSEGEGTGSSFFLELPANVHSSSLLDPHTLRMKEWIGVGVGGGGQTLQGMPENPFLSGDDFSLRSSSSSRSVNVNSLFSRPSSSMHSPFPVQTPSSASNTNSHGRGRSSSNPSSNPKDRSRNHSDFSHSHLSSLWKAEPNEGSSRLPFIMTEPADDPSSPVLSPPAHHHYIHEGNTASSIPTPFLPIDSEKTTSLTSIASSRPQSLSASHRLQAVDSVDSELADIPSSTSTSHQSNGMKSTKSFLETTTSDPPPSLLFPQPTSPIPSLKFLPLSSVSQDRDRLTVLVVDDVPSNRKVLVRMLSRIEKVGEILQAEDGMLALDLIRASLPSLGSPERSRASSFNRWEPPSTSLSSHFPHFSPFTAPPTGLSSLSAHSYSSDSSSYPLNPNPSSPSPPIHLVLMDSVMPVLDGPSAAREMRALGFRAGIVGVTGNVLPEDIEHFKRSGANEVMGKPVSFDQLRAFIESYSYTPPLPFSRF